MSVRYGAGTPIVNDSTDPICPGCKADLIDVIRWKPIGVEGHMSQRRIVNVLWCRNCSVTLGFFPPEEAEKGFMEKQFGTRGIVE